MVTIRVSQDHLSESFFFLKKIYIFPARRVQQPSLSSTSQRNNALLLQRSMEQSGNCDENDNNSEASSVSYLAVGMLSEKASGRTG